MWWLIPGALIAGHVGAAKLFRRKAERLMTRVGGGTPADVDVPDLVRAFAERAGVTETSPASIRYRQRCEIRFGPDQPWQNLLAEQIIGNFEPAFVWWAEGRKGPIVTARVIDAFVDQAGLLEARLFGTLPVAHATGPEADRGELLRYLAELPWAPDAMLRNGALRWRQIDADRVEVSADTKSGPVATRLIFENGDIVRTEADARPRQDRGQTVDTPWVGRFWDYREIGGRRVPARAEVSWTLPEGSFTYVRGEMLG